MSRVKRRHIFNFISDLLPGDGTRVSAIKASLLRWCGCKVGRNVKIGQYVHVFGDGDIEIGDGCWIATEVILQTTGSIKIGDRCDIMNRTMIVANGGSNVVIGDDCRIAHMVSIKTTCHAINPEAKCIGDTEEFKDILVGSGCWVCAGVVIVPGAKIGSKNVIAAGSVVLEATPVKDGVLLAGVPAECKKCYI